MVVAGFLLREFLTALTAKSDGPDEYVLFRGRFAILVVSDISQDVVHEVLVIDVAKPWVA